MFSGGKERVHWEQISYCKHLVGDHNEINAFLLFGSIHGDLPTN